MATAEKFKRIYNASNFTGIATANQVCQPSLYTQIGYLTVPPQQAVSWGATDVINGGATGRALYMRFDDTSGVQIHGTVRLELSNNTGTRSATILEERTERLSADQNDRTKAVLLPEDGRYGRQDFLLIIKFKPDAATAQTIDYDGTNTKILAPVSILQ